MRFPRNRIGLAGALALAATLLFPATTAGAATTYEVEVGHVLKGVQVPSESMRFLPSAIDIHQGDTLHFTSPSVHTATFLPVGQGVVDWFEANAVLGSSGPYALLRPNPDNGPTAFKFTNAAYFATDPTCGGPSQPACSFDGTSVLNSGLGFTDFSVTVNVSPGDSFWVVCLIHGPTMRLEVNVVPSAQPASDPAAIAAARKAAIAQDTNTARALYNKFSAKRTSHSAPDGTRVWDAWAGVDGRYVSVYGMFPRTLVINKGDTVQWHFDSLVYEDHTVSFPIDTARKIANVFNFVCDPDGDAGPGPDNPPDLPDYPYCNVPGQLELQLSNRFVLPAGNGVFEGKYLESSGVLGANSILGQPNYELKFTKRAPEPGFKYICMIHTEMVGRVIVK